MTGIYKITSPSGSVYIGQTINVARRKTNYKCGWSGGPRLKASFKSHGYVNHLFEVIHELPKDVTREVLDEFEKVYIDLYKGTGMGMLNLTEGGTGGRIFAGRKHSEETKRKIGVGNKGKERPAELRKILSEKNKGKKMSKAHREKLNSVNRGRKLSEEVKQRMSVTIKAALQKKIESGWVRPPMSAETGRKISQSKKGIATRPADYRHSEETKKKIGQANSINYTGRTLPEEYRKAIGAGNKRAWDASVVIDGKRRRQSKKMLLTDES